MTGIFSFYNQPALILFDSGASHSFISQKFSAKCQLPFYHKNGSFMIATPRGKISTNQLNQSVPIQLGSHIIKTTLLVSGLENVDIILGTNWMTRHQVVLDVASRIVEINCWGLVLKCYESRTRQHKMLNTNALRPLKHYLPKDLMNFGRRP
jgi:hypothetical protein